MPGGEGAAEAPAVKTSDISTKKRGEAFNLYLNSIINMRRGKYQDGIESMRDAADIDTDSRALQLRLLAVYYRDGDYENAATMAERALEKEPDSVMLHIWLGRIYTQLDRLDESMAMFQKAIALDPESQIAYEALAEVEEESNDLVGAIRVYETMLDQSPDSPFLHYRLGVNLMEMGDGERARMSLEKALSFDEKLTPARYILGVVYMELEEWEMAKNSFDRFLVDNPGHAPTLENLAAVHARMNDFSQSFQTLTGLIESANVDVRHHLQRTYVYLRNPGVASTFISAAPNDSPFLGTVLQILVKRQAGEPYASIVSSLDSIEGDLDFECNAYLSSLLTRFGTQDAGGFLTAQLKSLRDEGQPSKTLSTVLGRTLMYGEHAEEARVVFEDIIARFGSDKLTHYYLATAYESIDDPANTEVHLRKTLEYDPNDPDVLNFLGYLLADEDERLKEAEELIERALAYDPENGFYLDSLGWVYYRQGKGKQAVDYIKRAIRAMNSDDAVLRDHLGDAHLLNRDVEQALAEWERAHQLDPDLEGVKEKIEKHSNGKQKRKGT